MQVWIGLDGVESFKVFSSSPVFFGNTGVVVYGSVNSYGGNRGVISVQGHGNL